MTGTTCKLVTTDTELRDAFEVRREVFVREQGVTEAEEYDGLDGQAMQAVAKQGERVIGTARVRFPQQGQAKIERMAVLGPFRRKGVGSSIMSFLMSELRNRDTRHIVLHAQTAVAGFYGLHGFQETGLPFWEAGIEHIEMHTDL